MLPAINNNNLHIFSYYLNNSVRNKNFFSRKIVNGFFTWKPVLSEQYLIFGSSINQIIMRFLLLLFSIKFPLRYRAIITFLIILPFQNCLICQELPLGYISYFSHNCSNETLFNFLLPEYEQDWSIVQKEGQIVLQVKPSDDTLSKSFPVSRGVINNMILGDYILEFDVKTSIPIDSDTAGFCFLGPVKSSDLYYSLVFSKDTLRFFSMKNDSIQYCSNTSYTSLKASWNKIHIERDILSRSLHITINNDTQNSISFSDRNLVMGFIGFGSHHSIAYLRNIRLWAPTAIKEHTFQW